MAYINKDSFDLYGTNIINGVLREELFFEVEDPISFSISLLNKKGYKTIMSCSGHPFMNKRLWISLDDKHIKNFTLPNKFYFRDVDYITFICYDYEKDGIDILDEIVEANKILYKWVENLPENI